MTGMKRILTVVLGIGVMGIGMPCSASVVSADFNDLNTGNLSGQGGGAGFAGNWEDSVGPQVAANDLTAPIATGYALTQSGTAQRVSGSLDDRISTRNMSPDLSGTIWFSALMQAGTGENVGLNFNGDHYSYTSAPLLLFTGTNVSWTPLSGTTGSASGVFTLDETFLVVGRATVVNGTGDADGLTVWVNPVLSDGGTLNEADAVFSITGTEFNTSSYLNGMDRVGVAVHSGLLDMLYLSDNAESTAIADVTGVSNMTYVPVPEPASLTLLGLGGLLALRRRRQA